MINQLRYHYFILGKGEALNVMNGLYRPKLRPVSVQRTMYQGEPVFIMQDTLKLTEAVIALPQVLGPVAILCDGQHTISEIYAALQVQYGLNLPQESIEGLVRQFDEALLLEGETFDQAKQGAVAAYRAADFRPPALAGASYPADPDRLRRLLQKYIDEVGQVKPASPDIRAIISPHIDYPRGGPVYAQVWAAAAEAVRQAELIVILGTDHSGGLGKLTLTPQHYASPLGVMPTDQALVERLAERLGPADVFDEELHHREEWSIELELVWLQHIRAGEPCPLLPVLCGSFHHFMVGEASLDDEKRLHDFVKILRQEMKQRRTLIVASGDLAHLGPAFDGPPLDAAAQVKMKREDDELLTILSRGDAKTFFDFMQAGQYRRNVCGLSPFYFTLAALEETHGRTIAYERCPADYTDTSFVSVCGMILE